VDFALVEVVDIDVVVVIRFVAMEIIPRERLAQGQPEAKLKIARVARRGVQKILRLEGVPTLRSLATGQVSGNDYLTLVKSITYRQRLV
jgi:hypothetical protein